MIYDPRPLHLWQPDPKAIENLCCDLLSINKPCGFTNILVPSVEKIMHDHPYSSQSGCVPVFSENISVCSSEELPNVSETITVEAEDILEKLCLDNKERQVLEEKTRTQILNHYGSELINIEQLDPKWVNNRAKGENKSHTSVCHLS